MALHRHLQQKERSKQAEELLVEELQLGLEKVNSLPPDGVCDVRTAIQRSLQPVWETFCTGCLR